MPAPLPLLHALSPVAVWCFLFFLGVALIPSALRPPISVHLLPRIDALIGYSYTWFTPVESFPVLDLLAAVPYTIHTLLPFMYVGISLLYTPNPRLHTFLYTFGCMNLAAVVTHLLFPTAPPWYFAKYGTAPANYSMKGDPAILARVDATLNSQFFTKMYRDGGKVVFGTWPSLHAAWPYLMAVFRPRPASRPVRFAIYFYVVWVWWAAIYLQHHYLADVLGGALYAQIAVAFVRPKGGDPEVAPDGYRPPLLPVATEE